MPIALYKKIGISKDQLRDKIFYLYSSGLSQKRIALNLNCHVTVIENYFSEFNLCSRTSKEAAALNIKHCILTQKECEILDGWLLSDGHMDLNKSSGTSRLTIGLKYKEPLLRTKILLSNLDFSPLWQSSITKCFHMKSHSYIELSPFAIRWYINRKKIVPYDLKLTPLVCYYWFIGDGSRVEYGINLSTEGFDSIYVDFLKVSLNELGIKTTKLKSNRLRISSKSICDFYDLIGPCRDTVYNYKWRILK